MKYSMIEAYASEFGGSLYKIGPVGDVWFRIPIKWLHIFAEIVKKTYEVEIYNGGMTSPYGWCLIWDMETV